MYKDDITKGKDDWMNYVNKRKQTKEDREADKKHNEEIAKKQADKKEAKRLADKKDKVYKQPGQGFQLG